MGSYELLVQSQINKSFPVDSSLRYRVKFQTKKCSVSRRLSDSYVGRKNSSRNFVFCSVSLTLQIYRMSGNKHLPDPHSSLMNTESRILFEIILIGERVCAQHTLSCYITPDVNIKGYSSLGVVYEFVFQSLEVCLSTCCVFHSYPFESAF
jgi:hypothetical protein